MFKIAPFSKGGSRCQRFTRDSCCVFILLVVVILVSVFLPVITNIKAPLVELPDRTAVIRSNPTRTEIESAAEENPLLGNILTLIKQSDETPAPAPAVTAPLAAPTVNMPATSGGCGSAEDQSVWFSTGKKNFNSFMAECGLKCQGEPKCVNSCVAETEGFSDQCLACFGKLAGCSRDNCAVKCLLGSDNPKCQKCVRNKCNAGFLTCSGIPEEELRAAQIPEGRRLSTDDEVVEFLETAEGDEAKLVKRFTARPKCQDGDAEIAQFTDNKVTTCAESADLCSSDEFSTVLKLLCPITCDSLSPKCAECNDQDGMLSEETSGKLTSCKDAASSCEDAQFGSAVQRACTVTCDSCGVEFSTVAPTPVPSVPPVLALLTKLQDGTLVEDSITAAIKVLTQNPEGPQDAFDAWGYMFSLITMIIPNLDVQFGDASIPIVWHRPVDEDGSVEAFDFTKYGAYAKGPDSEAEAEGDEADQSGRRLQQQYYTEGATEYSEAASAPESESQLQYTPQQQEPQYYESQQQYHSTTIGYLKVPDETLYEGRQSAVSIGLTTHLTKTWIDTNRDFIEMVAFPIATPLVQEKMSADQSLPPFVSEALVKQLDVSDRPAVPDMLVTGSGTIPVEAFFDFGFSIKATVQIECSATLNAVSLSQKDRPELDCGEAGKGMVINIRVFHNAGIIVGIYFIAVAIELVVWYVVERYSGSKPKPSVPVPASSFL